MSVEGEAALATDVPGLDLDRFRSFYDRQRPGEINGPLRARVIAGGRSNLTYEVSDGTSWWVVRRPPLGHVLGTAHDMAREYRVISALRETDVPVPEAYVLCDDQEVIGAPFYVMERVIGVPYRSAAQLVALGRARTTAISEAMIDTLTTLHSVDPAEVGLHDFGRPRDFFERQVRRWGKQLAASRTRKLDGADELHALLQEHVPIGASAAIVHGDYRLDNLLVADDDHVAAVIDWEMATLGDPLTDIALLLVYQRWPQYGAVGPVVVDVGDAPGFIDADRVLQRYSSVSGRDVSAFGQYLGLAAYKLAVVLEGIHFRYLEGKTVGVGFESVGDLVEPLIAEGIRAVKSDN